MTDTWRDGTWSPTDEECRRMAEAVLDLWYVDRQKIVGPDREVEAVVIKIDDWMPLVKAIPPVYCGPTGEGEGQG